jgi:hypothetical protein
MSINFTNLGPASFAGEGLPYQPVLFVVFNGNETVSTSGFVGCTSSSWDPRIGHKLSACLSLDVPIGLSIKTLGVLLTFGGGSQRDIAQWRIG